MPIRPVVKINDEPVRASIVHNDDEHLRLRIIAKGSMDRDTVLSSLQSGEIAVQIDDGPMWRMSTISLDTHTAGDDGPSSIHRIDVDLSRLEEIQPPVLSDSDKLDIIIDLLTEIRNSLKR